MLPEAVPIPFCGQSYKDKSRQANSQETVNLYPMLSPTPDDPQRIVLYPTPGFLVQGDVYTTFNFLAGVTGKRQMAGKEFRGAIVINQTAYMVIGDAFLKGDNVSLIQSLGAAGATGWLNTTSGKVSMKWNTVEIVISDGQYGYTYNVATGNFAFIGGGSFPAEGVTNFAYQDGYILAGVNGSRRVIQSDLLAGGTYGPLAFADLASFPDNLVGVFSDDNQLYVFGPKVTEVRFNSGASPFAFEKVQGVLIQAGCLAIETVRKVGSTIMWLADDEAGSAYVAQLEGYSPQVVSHPPLNEDLARYSKADLAAASSYTYREADNQFYVLNLPASTWALDVKMRQWHQREYNGGADLPQSVFYWNGKHVAGDSDGILWYMSQDFSQFGGLQPGTTDAADYRRLIPGGSGSVPQHYPPRRTRTGYHLEADGKVIHLHELEFVIESGVGKAVIRAGSIDDDLEDPITNPQATLEISRDRGQTWAVVGTQPLGQQGQYKKRLVFRKLGKGRSITPRLTITDPAFTSIHGARARFTVLNK